MSTHDYNIGNQTFPAFRSDLNSALSAVLSNNSNATEPSTTAAYMDWVDTTNSVVKRRNSADSGWFITDTADNDRVITKTSNYTVTLADYGKTILVDASSNTVDITLLAAATADDNWFVTIKRIDNSGYKARIVPNGSETIDGLTEVLLDQYQSVTPISDASNYRLKQNSTLTQRRKNIIIGGDFSINPWQRGTSFTSLGIVINYTADRFVYVGAGAGSGVVSVLKTSDAPTTSQAGIFTQHCLHVDVTTAAASINSNDLYYVRQIVEGYNFTRIAGRPFTLSFWVKATKTGTYCVSFVNSGSDRSYVAEYTVSAADTWEKKTIVVLPSPSAGTWDYTTGAGLKINFVLGCGSTFQTTANSWQAGSFVGTSNQVNALDSTSNDFKLALIQLEAGNVATPFEHRLFNEELTLCRRFYQKTFSLSVTPAQNSGDFAGCIAYCVQVTGANRNGSFLTFPVNMRTAPTITFYNPSAANTKWRNTSLTADSGTPNAQNIGERGVFVENPQIAGDSTAGNFCKIHASMDAEL